jgi:membrane peptidoglycan carboxypeptidase
MPTPKAKKRKSSRLRKWILLLLVVLLLIPAMQVAVVRFINPPLTLPMLIEQGSAMFSSGPTPPLRYRWIALPQIPEMFLEHLWISEDQRFFQHEGFDWKEMELAMKKAERKGKPVRGASTITNQCARSIFLWRLSEHTRGASFATKSRGPWKLIYYEAYTEREDAEGRERFLKSGAGRRFLRVQLRHYLRVKGFASRGSNQNDPTFH